ncbi:MAG TPA: hypothetical protein DIT07_09585 [Sphingobacteriaceae bacterium]|nr:hypothetical protein [Sphingobacteriaceae bacterium]
MKFVSARNHILTTGRSITDLHTIRVVENSSSLRKNIFLSLLVAFFLLLNYQAFSQIKTPEENGARQLDSLRRIENQKLVVPVPNSKYIRYTTNALLKDSTQTLPLDTTLKNFENYSPIYQPERPTVNLGNVGLSAHDLLFTPSKTIGFDPGFHALDFYLLRQDSIRYYRARSPYTELYYINGGQSEQIFKVTHTQNIKPNWNFGANYFRNGSDGFYKNQKADHTNIALFTWYESPNKRYNILADILFNTLKAGENGSIVKDTIFTTKKSLSTAAEIVRLSADRASMPRQIWRQKGLSLKQIYYIGKIAKDSVAASGVSAIQRLSYSLNYTSDLYKFFRNEADTYGALPAISSVTLTNDSTSVKNLQNEFMYSFYLRGKSLSFMKNELKLDLGIQNNLYSYEQMGYKANFQNTTLKASLDYRFSNRVNITGDLNQLAYGKNIGDYLYEARANFLLSKSVGRIILGGYIQNKSPEQLFERSNYQYHVWDLNFDKTKTTNLSFAYGNSPFRLLAKADYYLITNYLYYAETAIAKQIHPVQTGSPINLLKLTLKKDFKAGKMNFDNYIVYQKTDFQSILRTPEVYTYNSIYFAGRFFKVLYTNIGFDVRYNTSFSNQAYSLNLSQFYNGPDEAEHSTFPIANVWVKATLKRTNLFLRYDFINDGMFSEGYYTVRRYPMPTGLLKFGLSWKFYN